MSRNERNERAGNVLRELENRLWVEKKVKINLF